MKVRQLLLLVSPLVLMSCAGQTWRANAGPSFARARGEFALQNSAGSNVLAGNQNSLSGNLGVGDTEVSPYLRVRTDIERHRIRMNGFYVDSEGSGTLAGDYGNILAGTNVQTSMDFFAIAANYGYQVLREEHYRVAVGGQLGFYSLDVSARPTGGPGREEVTSEVLVPMPWVEGEMFWEDFTLGASLGIMAGDLGDANGRYWDLEAYTKWQATEGFDLQVGYRYLLLDGYGRASSRDFDADVDVQGFYITGGVQF